MINAEKGMIFKHLQLQVVRWGADVGEAQLSDYDDIDDFHTTSQQLFNSGEATISGQDYKFADMNLTTRVIYVDDSATYINDDVKTFCLYNCKCQSKVQPKNG